MEDDLDPISFVNRWADTVGEGGPAAGQDTCACFDQYKMRPQQDVRFHAEHQDTSSHAWQRLLALIDEAAADGREVFEPLVGLSAQDRRQIITLPPTIAKLTRVKHFVLYGSNLVRIPPEIGAMTGLEEFSPYMSRRLHWFPYELTRCPKLTASTVSTRSLYGNVKLRPPFPALQSGRAATGDLNLGDLDPGVWGAEAIRTCSVCDRPIGESGLHQVWISLRVATDIMPLLANACSPACIQALPIPSANYVPGPHTGGPTITQPAADA